MRPSRILSSGIEGTRIQDELQRLGSSVADNPLSEVVILKNINFTSGTNTRLLHGLGRAANGFFVSRATVHMTLIDKSSLLSQQDRNTTALVAASATGVADVVVF